MFALARLVIIGFVALSIVYVCLSLYSRSVRKSKLIAEWDANPDGDKDAFVDRGLEEYSGSLKRKLLLGVYIVPVLLVALIVYLTNFA